MVSIVIAVVLILFGSAVITFAPASTPVRSRRVTRLAGFGIMALGLTIVVVNAIVVIGVGEVGVQHFLGSVSKKTLNQGVHVINPFASVEKMSVREQGFPSDGSIEHMEAQTSEQMNVALDVSLLYRLDGTRAPELYQRLGTQRQIEQALQNLPAGSLVIAPTNAGMPILLNRNTGGN